MSDAKAPTRGERNSNPCNLNFDPHNQWAGQTGIETIPEGLSETPRFAAFRSPLWGIRAAALDLLNYQRLHHLGTLREILGRFAPHKDGNAVDAYVADVAERIDRGPDELIDLESPDLLARLVTAIIQHENGRCVYSASLIANAVDEALGRDARPIGAAH